MSEQNTTNEKPHNITDRYKVRRTVALLALAMVIVMVCAWLYAVFEPDRAVAERLNEVSGFGGMLVSACLTLIMGYKVSVHLDDQNERTAQTSATGPRPINIDVDLPAPRPSDPLERVTEAISKTEPVHIPDDQATASAQQAGNSPVAALLRRAQREGGKAHQHVDS